jgi:HSP20 family molecular chaperone IbpA
MQIDRAFDTWSRRMERLFRPFEQPLTVTSAGQLQPSWTSRALIPAIDLVDSEKELVMHTELPV